MPQKPPPLPPSGPPTEPFRPSDTPPTGTLLGLPRPELPPLPPGFAEPASDMPGPREMARLIRGLRQDIVLLRDSLPQLIGSIVTSAPPPPLTPMPPSKRQAATQAFGNVAKYTTLAIGVLGIAAQVAAQFKPGLVGPIQTVIQLLGGSP